MAAQAVVGAGHNQRQALHIQIQVFKTQAHRGGFLLAGDGNGDARAGLLAGQIAHQQGDVIQAVGQRLRVQAAQHAASSHGGRAQFQAAPLLLPGRADEQFVFAKVAVAGLAGDVHRRGDFGNGDAR